MLTQCPLSYYWFRKVMCFQRHLLLGQRNDLLPTGGTWPVAKLDIIFVGQLGKSHPADEIIRAAFMWLLLAPMT